MKQSEVRALIESRVTVDLNGCWLWPGEAKGYGTTCINGKWYGTHRLSYMAYHGRIGKQHVLHTCDTPKCVNPRHLFLGTHEQNMQDMAAKDRGGRRESGKLTDEQVREMRRKYDRGVPVSWLASEFGTSNHYTRDIVRRRVKGGYESRYHADETA